MVQKLAVKLGAKSLLLLNDCEIKKNNQMLSSVNVFKFTLGGVAKCDDPSDCTQFGA